MLYKYSKSVIYSQSDAFITKVYSTLLSILAMNLFSLFSFRRYHFILWLLILFSLCQYSKRDIILLCLSLINSREKSRQFLRSLSSLSRNKLIVYYVDFRKLTENYQSKLFSIAIVNFLASYKRHSSLNLKSSYYIQRYIILK